MIRILEHWVFATITITTSLYFTVQVGKIIECKRIQRTFKYLKPNNVLCA